MRSLHSAVLLAASTFAATLSIVACSTSSREATSADAALPPVPPPLALGQSKAYDAALLVRLPAVQPDEEPGLHNVFQLSEEIVSGGEPHGEEAFKKLQEMGVRTVLSVDGKVPDQELAAKYGMTYVHVPIQYKGITVEEQLQIAKTFREKEGPFYVHCFHGQHRGPAAAAIGRIVLDGATREQALAEMRQWCGTSDKYEGLYRVIADAAIPDAAATRGYAWDFPAAHSFAGFRHAMIDVSRADDNLKHLSKRGWQADPEHPDVDALNEAAKLTTTLESSAALPEVAEKPDDFRGWLNDSVKAAEELREAIRSWREAQGAPTASLDAAYARVAKLCTDCHKAYRN